MIEVFSEIPRPNEVKLNYIQTIEQFLGGIEGEMSQTLLRREYASKDDSL
ncbi:predicted protein [Sclerotinia sclerotiorum 1980 UF-70]|uniref:Uncharacterized protein n=1 Tax=Sclerotinia sclerotiorum (strain ATCC 18683 / 1980 / Ss-1) TaxID=665079 RepID=A7F801_SCLS1|nr:predicted protein [Sclerotinia sclerotiorum 1980 UF-70]EDN98872.1 predicted protein [Sclerotinia sclerotiorum 1980 UF-70]